MAALAVYYVAVLALAVWQVVQILRCCKKGEPVGLLRQTQLVLYLMLLIVLIPLLLD